MAGFHQRINRVTSVLGELRIVSHQCLSFLPERKNGLLTQLASHSDSMGGTSELNSRLLMLFVVRSMPDVGQGGVVGLIPKERGMNHQRFPKDFLTGEAHKPNHFRNQG